MHKIINNKVQFKIFDKSFKKINGMFGIARFQDINKINMVKNNYKVIIDEHSAKELLVLKQVHGSLVIDADYIDDFTKEPEADGMVASKKGIILSIQTADCVPVLLASNDGTVIGAAHCGWRSTVDNILEKVIYMMKKKGANGITAILGPAIHQENYEVDQIFYDKILSSEPLASCFFKKKLIPGKWLFDLPKFVIMKLNKLEIFQIINHCEDTFSNENMYYSYRRDLDLWATGNQGHILSTIVISDY